MTVSRMALRIVRGALTAVALASFALVLYSSSRWNELFLKAKPVPASLCQSHPAEFQIVEMKSSVCVPLATAVEWRANERLLTMAVAIIIGVLLIGAATQRAAEEEEAQSQSNLPAVGLVACTIIFIVWGIWPAVIAAGLMVAAFLARRLWSHPA
jgi:K+-sensing histidine kinase KdpD